MRRRQHAHRWAFGIALTAVMAFIPQSSSQADEWYPGLPDATFGNWAGAAQGGMSYAKRAKQWIISPMGMATAEVNISQDPYHPEIQRIRAASYFVSPKGAPSNYGYMEPMTVRSVGFGLMPVEATVQISQRRASGYPIPINVLLETSTEFVPAPGNTDCSNGCIQNVTFKQTTISASFNVRVLDVKVDGVDMGLDGNCHTAQPAPVVVTSPEYTIDDIARYPNYQIDWYRTHDPSTYYHPIYGGEFSGSMTIPPFTGCTTKTGDDLSRLLTLSASGPGNPVVARSGWPCSFLVNGANAPVPPGVSNPKLGGGHAFDLILDPRHCPGVKPFNYPQRPEN